jgi:CelD/BcsL family acetyltransferase involved in cellulose biosynthesis
MAFTIIDSLQGLESLRSEWTALYERCPNATPFQSPQWLIPWMRRMYKGGEIWTLAIREYGELIGFAPIFRWGVDQRTISFLGAGISDYGDILFAPGKERECIAAVWDLLEIRRDRWDRIDLKELRRESGLLEGQSPEVCSVCPVLDLARYPATMDRKHRTDVRRAQNKLQKHAQLQFELANEQDLTTKLEEFFRLYELRWGEMETSLRKFHTEVASEFLATGSLRLCLLRIDGAAAAAIYAFTEGKTLYFYLSGYDPSLAKSSPGAVLVGWMIERAIEEGMLEADFLRKPEAYKYLWGAQDRVTYKLCLNRDSMMDHAEPVVVSGMIS